MKKEELVVIAVENVDPQIGLAIRSPLCDDGTGDAILIRDVDNPSKVDRVNSAVKDDFFKSGQWLKIAPLRLEQGKLFLVVTEFAHTLFEKYVVGKGRLEFQKAAEEVWVTYLSRPQLNGAFVKLTTEVLREVRLKSDFEKADKFESIERELLFLKKITSDSGDQRLQVLAALVGFYFKTSRKKFYSLLKLLDFEDESFRQLIRNNYPGHARAPERIFGRDFDESNRPLTYMPRVLAA